MTQQNWPKSSSDPGDAIPYVKATWHYARGVAHASRGDFAAAMAEANDIETLERTADFSLLKAGGVPAQDVLKLARTVIQGRVAQAQWTGSLSERARSPDP
jgi:hypothetical protein